jgi:hypothetical protein
MVLLYAPNNQLLSFCKYELFRISRHVYLKKEHLMHLHKMLKTALFLLSGTALYAAPVITLNVNFPSEKTQIPHTICATKDNGFVIGGTTTDSTGARRGFLLRADHSGRNTGTVDFPSSADNEVIATIQTFDGGYAECGYSASGSHGGDDWTISKLDSSGNKVWKRELGFAGSDRPYSMIETADSGLVVAGYSSGGSVDTAATLLKLDRNGQVEWYRIYGNGVVSDRSIAHCVKQTRDGGYILTGVAGGLYAWNGGKDAFLLKTDSRGTKQWYKAYGSSGDEFGYSLDTTSDGGYVIAGSTTSFGSGMEDVYIVKTDSVGKFKAQRTFGGSGSDVAYGIISRTDGYVFAATMRSHSSDSAAMIYQLNQDGDSVRATGFSGSIGSKGASLRSIGSNGFALCYTKVENGDTTAGVVVFSGIVAKIAAGSDHSLILKIDGTLWACGANWRGQLGDGTTTDRSTPVQIMSGVQSMAAGYCYSLILKTDGTLWACGSNVYGQLGDGTTTNRSTPVQIMSGVKNMSAGETHSLILKTDGALWACGNNVYGQLGDGTTTNRSTPVQIMSGVKNMSAGETHSLILKTDGALWACGNNGYGKLGDGTATRRKVYA